MKPITATMACQEVGDDQFLAPDPAAGFMFVAGEMLRGAQILGSVQPLPCVALTHLSGHVAETALKGMLAHSGVAPDILKKRQFGHSLTALWHGAVERRIPLPSQPPIWLEQLNRVHNDPYPNRYHDRYHMVVLPAQEEMLQGVTDLHETATRFLNEAPSTDGNSSQDD